ncbi:MAG: plastocyanin/azurin family copper-binding protein [Cyclobacteriaceae bacterium]
MNRKIKQGLFLLAILLVNFTLSAQENSSQVTNITLNVIPGLQFDKVRFWVRPGENIRLTLSNDDDMGHNLLITTPGSRLEVVQAAQELAENGPMMDYIPESPKVLWSMPVIYSGESKTIEFKAPEDPGAYPYVCTYPGHGFIMYGVMYVSNEMNMPALSKDENIPPSRREEQKTEENPEGAHTHHAEKRHPYETIPPYLYRVFMEGSGLASIAVHLPQQLSYCWDAGACKLQFAWEGGFLDNSDLWHGHKNAYAHVLGEIFYRDQTAFPFRIGDLQQIPETEFLGYRLINRYPEFKYLLSGVEVHEIIHPKEDGSGFIRTVKMPGINQTVWFLFHPEDGVDYRFSEGERMEGKLKLTPEEAREFIITMTKVDKK